MCKVLKEILNESLKYGATSIKILLTFMYHISDNNKSAENVRFLEENWI